MNLKLFFTILSTITAIAAYVPYARDIFALKTKPHAYTWLIWTITQGIGVLGIWYGGGSWAVLSLAIGTVSVFCTFLFSLKYGTKNITRSDTVILFSALCAILVWWQLKQPLLAVVMVSVIDTLGYIPSLRKTYLEPWSETMISWLAFAAAGIFALIALHEYNLLTMIYLIAMTLANIALLSLCFFVTVRFWVAKYQEYQASEPDLLIRMRGYKYRLDV